MAAISLDVSYLQRPENYTDCSDQTVFSTFEITRTKGSLYERKKLFGLIHQNGHCYITLEHQVFGRRDVIGKVLNELNLVVC